MARTGVEDYTIPDFGDFWQSLLMGSEFLVQKNTFVYKLNGFHHSQNTHTTMEENAGFSLLEKNILKAKGLNEEQVELLIASGIQSKADFTIVGDAQTLADITDIDLETAQKVMTWAIGAPAAQAAPPVQESSTSTPQTVVVEGADVVKCVHCGTKQPKDYKTGDLCLSCGNQAEPVLTCYWCSSSGPGKFCRSCGAEFVPSSDLEIAVLMKREGEAKNIIAKQLKEMTPGEKENMWARIRKMRGDA
ncbi:hypothetical protein AAG747_00915 [Rapidithrix thailandica]|uniref:Uncharacterized protein n=1 Tax=Rapidithrix thailandica TaxID=413964 RepID=A0AAW9S663_9BACT